MEKSSSESQQLTAGKIYIVLPAMRSDLETISALDRFMSHSEEDAEEDFVLVQCFVRIPHLGRVFMSVPMPRAMFMEMHKEHKENERREREITARNEMIEEWARQDRFLLLSLPPSPDPSSFKITLFTLEFSLTINSRIIAFREPPSKNEEDKASRPLYIKDNLELSVQIRGRIGDEGESCGSGQVGKNVPKRKGKATKKEAFRVQSPWREAKIEEKDPGRLVISVQPSTNYLMRARVGEKQLTDNLRTITAWCEWGPEIEFTTDLEPAVRV